jgi:glycosyltransferase involved in cell wall biosynthesis
MSVTKKRFIIVSHKYLTQPDDDFVSFLNQNKAEVVLHICHSFTDAPDRRSFYSWYKNGELFEANQTNDYVCFPDFFIYLKELFFTVKWISRTKGNWDYFIGMDGLCVLFGFISGFFTKIEKTIFWAIDFVPKDRFKGFLRNWIYHSINTYSYRHVDEMWDLGARMMEAREKFLGVSPSDYKARKVVPYGVWLNSIKSVDYLECEKHTLVFMGHLIEKQGVQLVIQAISEIIKFLPEFRFKIIGGGAYKSVLEKMAADLGVQKYCTFLGKMEHIDELHKEIAKSAVAIAPYIKELDRWTYYTDPGKVKTYLACGVPLLLTNIPWNALEIEQQRCGFIISEKNDDIVKKTLLLLGEDLNIEYRKNALKYSQNFDYEKIFRDLHESL